MAKVPFRFTGLIKRFVPRSLLGRSLLIILLPLLLLEGVALQIFYGTHLSVVSRRFASSIAGEIASTLDLLRRFPAPADQAFILSEAYSNFGLVFHFDRGETLLHMRNRGIPGPMDADLAAALSEKIGRPFRSDWTSDPQSVLIRVQMPNGVLSIEAPRKRLYTATIYIFVVWLAGSSLLLFLIAALFMRIQVRAIRRLAQAAAAFNRMQERIRRFLTQRTEMLAGVSHDLRTPLTRLRLALAMLPQSEETRAEIASMTADLDEMNHMIDSYLAFARGEGIEQAQDVDLSSVLKEIVQGARRTGAEIELTAPPSLMMKLRPNAVRRAITNLVDNACRHARRVVLAAVPESRRMVQVTVDDDGPGIPQERRESVFRAFESGAAGGTGLGLAIARDIVRAHGGDIFLEDSPLGGLRARIRLPV